ncbi:hypothetical protein Tco_0201353 [Tanacetum coccineum]
MTAKQVYKLNGSEKVLVHVNKDYQLIKNSGGLCSRFMTLILKEPNLCPPDAKDWKECKDSCAAMLIAELRRRFSIPQGESVDKVLSTMLSRKRRIKTYTEDELLVALDLLEPPENFLEHQWRVYKSHLRKPIAKKLSLCGKKARNDQVHTHTTGAVSFARTNDIYVIENQEISSKVKELVGPEGIAEDAVVEKIAREVLNKLLGNEEPRCYGAGVIKSQISKFCCDLKRMRGKGLADENHFLKEKNKKVKSYKKQVETQGLQMKNMEQKLNEVYGMLKLLPAFPDLDNVASTSTSTAVGTCDKQIEPDEDTRLELDEDTRLELDEDKRLDFSL